MNKEALLIRELAEVTGTDVELDASGICELVASGNLIVLRYRETSGDWLCFGVVLDGGDDALPHETLSRALELGLFGAETGGFSLGLHGNALVLSDIVPSENLTAEVLVERLLALSDKITSISERLEGADAIERGSEEEAVLSAFDDRFLKV